MRPGGGKSKGASFERTVAKLVIKAACRVLNISKKDIYRTPGSGGHRYASKTDPSDLVISKRLLKRFPFTVECKWYKSVNFGHFWTLSTRRRLSWKEFKWVDQVLEENSSFRERRIPIVVFKQNKGSVFCLWCDLDPVARQARKAIVKLRTLKPKLKIKFRGNTWYLTLFSHVLRRLFRIPFTSERRQQISQYMKHKWTTKQFRDMMVYRRVSKEARERMSSVRLRLFRSGEIEPSGGVGGNRMGYIKCKGTKLFYRSDYERSFLKWCDEAPFVKEVQKPRGKFGYRYKGKDRMYFPDFLVTLKHGEMRLVEIKDHRRLNDVQIKKKFAVAREFIGDDFIVVPYKVRSLHKLRSVLNVE